MDQDDPEKRIADLEHQPGEQKHDADLRPADHDPGMEIPPQTPGYRRREGKKVWLSWLILVALFAAFLVGFILMARGLERKDSAAPSVVGLGIALMLASVLILVGWAAVGMARGKKEAALRKPGTVQLLTAASTFFDKEVDPDFAYWKLTSDMRIRLDSGHTFRGSYHTTIDTRRMRRTRGAYTPDGKPIVRQLSGRLLPHFDEWFRVGAKLPCLYDPANPDKVVVFPAGAVDARAVRYSDFHTVGSGDVWFYSAT